ncbi:hypothetical protein psyc5s11_13100 [Clostridium gelidum]|uniref:Prepilin-type N-terminal cleavage/methylation domain-containing protein n=1 Tax=Clostridium gelidum TaxID=704125 RepID=A0ABN6IV22_9CLOT|nr:prepilin-type N-terminal cleavage/methylation domain-containing protein [Clostridium gelidum]BCZ45243.1 hypothetical protein psyc5s11_13100 [Clostridium gelidum]
MKSKCKKRSGFTLVEMIISMALFAILMTPIYSMIISSMSHNKNGAVKQTAALHGQEVFEKIKSGSVVVDGGGNITKIDDIDISTPTNEVINTLGDGYKAKVTITKNNDISINKKNNTVAVVPFEFAISLRGSTKDNLTVNGEHLSSRADLLSSDNPLVLVINTTTSTTTTTKTKTLTVKDENNNEVLNPYISKELPIAKDMDEIKVTINFDDYTLKKIPTDKKYKKVKIIVYNQDDSPLNIYLKKTDDLDVEVDNKLGKINPVEDGKLSQVGELYNIEVKVTHEKDNIGYRVSDEKDDMDVKITHKEDEEIFTEKTSQNINVN